MKRLLLIFGAVILVVGGLAAPVAAQDDTGVVTVTVQAAVISVTVSPDAVSYGVVSLNAEDLKPVEPYSDPRISAANTGTSWVDFTIRGAHTDNWILGGAAGNETYVHYFGMGPTGNVTYTPLTYPDYQDLGGYVSHSPGDVMSFMLMMDTPTESAYFGVQTTAVTVMVTMVEQGISLALDTDSPSYPLGGGPAVLTANVTDNVSAPVTGIPSGNFLTFVSGIPGAQPVTFTETGSGIYSGNLTISAFPSDNYTVAVRVSDALSRRASGWDDFEITP